MSKPENNLAIQHGDLSTSLQYNKPMKLRRMQPGRVWDYKHGCGSCMKRQRVQKYKHVDQFTVNLTTLFSTAHYNTPLIAKKTVN